MHPMFKELFIQTDDDLLAEEDRQRRVRRSRRARPALVVRPAAVTGSSGRGRDQRPAAHSLTLDTRRTGWCQMPTATQTTVTPLDMDGARCQALFSSGLQPSDAPTAGIVATAISRAVQQLGIGGGADQIAQEPAAPRRAA
jgi:hypothetical protein